MKQLGIEKLRPGAEGWNTNSPTYQNTLEAKANPYPNLPAVLRLDGGQEVTTAARWWRQRRPELVEALDREVYGRVPKDVPKVTWEVTSLVRTNRGAIPILRKTLVGHVDNSSYPLLRVDIPVTLTTPAAATGPVPVMLSFGFDWSRFTPRLNRSAATNRFRAFPGFGQPNWEDLVLSNGWGYAVIVPTGYQADNGAGLTKGIIGLCNKGQPRKPEDWGALRAWAWGASRALDYFETDAAVDARQVGIEGLSRYGKATLVTMAYDQRFAIALVGSSGKGGAALFRRHFGEQVENLTGTGEYHWMAGNFLKYGGPLTPGDLPVDSHELIALCAPRPVFISYGAAAGRPGVEGTWVDQQGSFMAAVAAGPVYQLLGKKGLAGAEDPTLASMPPINTALTGGELAWRQHAGGHTDGPNWPAFLHWANRYLHGPPPAARAAAP